MSYDMMLSRLEGVRSIPPNATTQRRARAFCPCHQPAPHKPGRAPSLSIAESLTGVILVHCHAGCSSLDVLQAAGLELPSLFPDRRDAPSNGGPNVWLPAAALIEEAANIVDQGLENSGFTDDDWHRLEELAGLIRQEGRSAARRAAKKS